MILGTYTNGNYRVKIYNDGTKVRMTDADHFSPSFAESMDMKVTDKCDGKCSFCYANAYPTGKSIDMQDEGVLKFLDSIHPYTEVAVNLNDMTWNELPVFLKRLSDHKVIVNGTINIRHITQSNRSTLITWQDNDMIKGIGVSILTRQDLEVVPEVMFWLDNAVFHVVCGLIDEEFINTIIKDERFRKMKLLILGYKAIDGKGYTYFKDNKDRIIANTGALRHNLAKLMDAVDVISFDNLAIDQLDIRSLVDTKAWDRSYMGDEGEFTYYVDMVNKKFAPSSTASESLYQDINGRSSIECFKEVRRVYNEAKKEETGYTEAVV
ncbi:MAG: hypothetical protein J6Y02_04430 [Pseudobutyrivibrio sp.]|nr:hypothetical protein [Pseudobutyrivibrio sp.]